MTGAGRRARGLMVAVAFVSASCAMQKQVVVDFSETPRDYLPNDYSDVYERWTRHDYSSRNFDKALEVWATFKSWDFRESYIEKYASVYSLPDAKRTELRQAQREAYQQAFEFHVTAQSQTYDWNDSREGQHPLAGHARSTPSGASSPRSACGSRSSPTRTSASSSLPRRHSRRPTVSGSSCRRPAAISPA